MNSKNILVLGSGPQSKISGITFHKNLPQMLLLLSQETTLLIGIKLKLIQ